MHWRKVLFLISTAYLVTLLISILMIVLVIPRFEDVGYLNQGCYVTDAMVTYVNCKGFFGSKIVKLIINIPYQLIYLPIFGVLSIIRAPWLIFIALFAWTPIIYFVWYLIKKPKVI